VPLIQINGWPTPLGPSTPKGLDTDIMAQRTVVIVVDDDAGPLKSVARLLAHHGIESRTFASAEALLESNSVQTASACWLIFTSGEFRELSYSAGLRHRDRSGPSSS
jgi:DNA-binding NtrC family response regulator